MIHWLYNRYKYRDNAADPERQARHGLAISWNKNVFVYAAFGVLYTVATIGFEKYGLDLSLGGIEWAPVLFQAFFWGFAFHHYYLDSKIWKASEDADLRAVLGFYKPKKASNPGGPPGPEPGSDSDPQHRSPGASPA